MGFFFWVEGSSGGFFFVFFFDEFEDDVVVGGGGVSDFEDRFGSKFWKKLKIVLKYLFFMVFF